MDARDKVVVACAGNSGSEKRPPEGWPGRRSLSPDEIVTGSLPRTV
jgi:hypothetical protein